jgi:hypothetical protein
MTAWRITLLATQWLLLSAQTATEPYYKPRPLTPEYVEQLRAKGTLPPKEFDYEYKGELTIKRGSQDDLRKACPNVFRPGNYAIGCTYRWFDGSACTVYIVNDNVLQSINWDYDLVLRHELGHCNGWKHPQ